MKNKRLLTLIVVTWVLVIGSACQNVPVPQDAKARLRSPDGGADQKSSSQSKALYGTPTKIGVLEDRAIDESSGIVASRTTPGVYWTHNDSGDGPFLYAFDERGRRRGVWRVPGAVAFDWEDIAAGPGLTTATSYLYVGDIGDNGRTRSQVIIYRVPEPIITAPSEAMTNSPSSRSVPWSTRGNPQLTAAADVIRMRYPDGRHDAETLLVHPVSGKIYIITKVQFGNAGVYEADAAQSTEGVIMLRRVGELSVPTIFGAMLTGGDISPDGRRVALCDYVQAYEIVLPDSAADFNAEFNSVWKQPLNPIALGRREQGEAIAYRLDGQALFATSEGRPAALFQAMRH